MIELRKFDPEHRVRQTVTLEYTPSKDGTEELKLPAVTMGTDSQGKPRIVKHTLKKGDNHGISMRYFHALGGDPAMIELIATGAIRPVCRDHVFDDHMPACRYCGEPNPLY
jgi:hypothetical protein